LAEYAVKYLFYGKLAIDTPVLVVVTSSETIQLTYKKFIFGIIYTSLCLYLN